jgi:hypothetical protein
MSAGFEQFRVLPEHVTLLSNARVGWNDCENGAPSVDCKYPYGDYNVAHSMVTLLKLEPDHPDRPDEDYDDYSVEDWYAEATVQRMYQLHAETRTVLEIVLNTGSLQPGLYEREKYGGRWARIAD